MKARVELPYLELEELWVSLQILVSDGVKVEKEARQPRAVAQFTHITILGRSWICTYID